MVSKAVRGAEQDPQEDHGRAQRPVRDRTAGRRRVLGRPRGDAHHGRHRRRGDRPGRDAAARKVAARGAHRGARGARRPRRPARRGVHAVRGGPLRPEPLVRAVRGRQRRRQDHHGGQDRLRGERRRAPPDHRQRRHLPRRRHRAARGLGRARRRPGGEARARQRPRQRVLRHDRGRRAPGERPRPHRHGGPPAHLGRPSARALQGRAGHPQARRHARPRGARHRLHDRPERPVPGRGSSTTPSGSTAS